MKSDFDSLEYSSIQSLKTRNDSKKILKVWCHIAELEDPQFVYLDCITPKFYSTVTLVDDKNHKIESQPVSKRRYKALEKRAEVGMPIEVTGKIVRVEKGKSKKDDHIRYINRLSILKTRPGDKPTRILNASKNEIKIVKNFLKMAKGKIKSGDTWYLLNTIKDAMINKFELAGVDKILELRDSIETMILQAVSCGFVKNSNGKIHVCLIGGSASAKKLCFKIGERTNIICQEAYPRSVTAVGLTGACVKNGKWSVTKGAVPLAHKGLFGIQDLDKSSKIGEILEVLSFVMEDGKCIVKKAGKAEFLAETGIYIDLNRQSDLALDDTIKVDVINDTKLRTHILSRFDYICEFNKDVERQFKAVIESLSKKDKKEKKIKDVIYRYCQKNGIDIKRFHKLISAYILEKFEKVDTDDIEKYIRRHFKEMQKINRDNLNNLKELHQFLFRYRNSCFKFIESLTRIQLRKKANKVATEKAFDLLSRKLKFLGNLMPLKPPTVKKIKDQDFRNWLYRTYSNMEFEMKKAYKQWKKNSCPGGKVEFRQFHSRVKQYAKEKKDKHGLWKLK
jgi:hypothetical protein